MRKKMSILITILVLFMNIVTPYCQNCYASAYIYEENSRHVIQRSDNRKIENVCRSTSISPRIQPEKMNYVFFDICVEKEKILSKEFESVVVEPKYRPQQARKNVTTDSTNKHS